MPGINTGWDDHNFLLIGLIQPLQLSLLSQGSRDDPIGACQYPALPFQAGRPLPIFSFCGDVPQGFAFVATPVPSSLDSRYFGPVPIDALTVARPLWTF